MLEKYYHSRGAEAFDQGRLNSAIRFFRKALSLEDQAYTACHLGLAYAAKSDLARALAAMDRAVDLSPSTGEYHHQRGLLWRQMGNEVRAEEDLAEAAVRDPDYDRVERIRKSWDRLEEAFEGSEAVEKLLTSEVTHRGLGDYLEDVRASAEKTGKAVGNRSCILPCPAFCCCFGKEPILHGAYIGPWKLQAVRRFLRDRGLEEKEFLAKAVLGPEELRLRLLPPDVVIREKGRLVVYYPRRKGRVLGRAGTRGLPVGRAYRHLPWITEKSRRCAFLAEGKCLIHDLGEEPALPACKEFLCLTGFVFLILEYLGFVTPGRIKARAMEELNRVAVEALLVLSERLYGDERLFRIEARLAAELKAAVEAEQRGEYVEVDVLVASCRRLREEYAGAFLLQKERVKNEIECLLSV
jgi:tetratricopeptide (TPR) repeat protein